MHLDLKPANLLLTSDGRLRLADFGNCHLLLRDMAREREREKEGDAGGLRGVQGSWRCELAGTLAYRAPELLKGEPPSLQADIYSLGITLWQIVSGSGVVVVDFVLIDVVVIVLLAWCGVFSLAQRCKLDALGSCLVSGYSFSACHSMWHMFTWPCRCWLGLKKNN